MRSKRCCGLTSCKEFEIRGVISVNSYLIKNTSLLPRLLNVLMTLAEVKLTSDHQVTVEAGNHLPHGTEIEPVDPTYSGREIPVEISRHSKDKGCRTDLIDKI